MLRSGSSFSVDNAEVPDLWLKLRSARKEPMAMLRLEQLEARCHCSTRLRSGVTAHVLQLPGRAECAQIYSGSSRIARQRFTCIGSGNSVVLIVLT